MPTTASWNLKSQGNFRENSKKIRRKFKENSKKSRRKFIVRKWHKTTKDTKRDVAVLSKRRAKGKLSTKHSIFLKWFAIALARKYATTYKSSSVPLYFSYNRKSDRCQFDTQVTFYVRWVFCEFSHLEHNHRGVLRMCARWNFSQKFSQ